MAELHNEWLYRIYQQWLDTLKNNGYIFFTTLTYRNDYLPHLSEFVDIPIGSDYDYPCFCYEDYADFVKNLRRQLEYNGFDMADSLKFFVCSEYGTAEQYSYRGRVRMATHRPHYHVLFFVYDKNLSVDTFRAYIDKAWFFGRTDKVRKYGSNANYIVSKNNRSELAVSNYIAKYVQKVSKFQSVIDSRINYVLRELYKSRFTYYSGTFQHNFDAFLPPLASHKFYISPKSVKSVKECYDYDEYQTFSSSQYGREIKRKLNSLVNQFHRQSRGFGASILETLDPIAVMNDGFLLMPDKQHIVRKIPIPKYYERKLFEELVPFTDTCRVWQPTLLGMRYRQKKQMRLYDRLVDRYRALSKEFNLDLPCEDLARYVVYQRGRYKGSIGAEPRFEDKMKMPNKIYLYSTPRDKQIFHGSFVSFGYFIDTSLPYLPIDYHLKKCIPLSWFVKHCCYFDKRLDELLDIISKKQHFVNVQKQQAFDLKQELKNKFKQQAVIQPTLFD